MTGSEILSLPVGCERLLVSSDPASGSARDTLAACQKCGPSAVRLTFLVLRLNSRTPVYAQAGRHSYPPPRQICPAAAA